MLPAEKPKMDPERVDPVFMTVIGRKIPVLPAATVMMFRVSLVSKKSRTAAPGPT
jgi:hypothetical protein